MPIYEYECRTCGEVFELLQRLNDPPPDKCPKCGSKNVAKRMSLSSFVLKGSGWYVTDYGKKDGGGEKGRKSNGNGQSSVGEKSSKSEKSEAASKSTSSTKAEAAGSKT